MDALGSHCPSLGVMELVNFVGFGGQPAADIIGPTKTITGATNLLYDMIKDNINGIVAGAEGAARLGQAVGDFVGSNRYVDSAVTAASDAAAAAADAAASVGNAA
jgi:hypothetical protein